MASAYNYKLNLLLIIICTIYLSFSKGENILLKDKYATVPQIIAAYGYNVESYRVQTTDDYILQMFRIPAGKGKQKVKGKKAILIVSGLGSYSGDFAIMGPDRSLSFLLADADYDVWLANLRGTDYSTHKYLTRNDPKFWDFSFHEHGKYDVPALIDRVLNITGLPKLLYIGYSMGTTSFFTMMSQRPEYNNKTIAFVALAPAVYIDNLKELATSLLIKRNMSKIFREKGMFSLKLPAWLLHTFCNFKNPHDICLRLVGNLAGDDPEQIDEEMFPIVISRAQPMSVRQLEHYSKLALTGAFTTLDEGVHTPVKLYNISNVRVPVSIFYGENDQLTHKSGVMQLAKELNSTGVLESIQSVSWSKFNHLDFVFAKDVGNLLNKPLVKHINNLFDKYG